MSSTTEFAKTCNRIDEILSFLNLVQSESFTATHQQTLECVSEELRTSIAEKVTRFKSRAEETDPEKRTYGPAMVAKVNAFVKKYEDVMQVFSRVSQAVTANYEPFLEQEAKRKQEAEHQIHQQEDARKQQDEEEQRRRQQAEHERFEQLRKASLQELAEHRQIFLRRQDRERTLCHQKEAEVWADMESQFWRELQRIEEGLELRRRKEEARDEKRRRLGNILEQHRQVKVKGEQQLIAEAIAASLQDGADSQSPRMDSAASTSQAEDCDGAKGKKEGEIPPAADLEAEEKLIKQAIEMSLQLSATPIASNGNPRVDKRPDAQSP